MANPDTVIALKTSFLNSQIRILNAPLEPSRNWRDHGPAPQDGDLKERVVQEILHKRASVLRAIVSSSAIDGKANPTLRSNIVNSIVRHHNRAAYSFQALRHVAEQIDRLYWASGAPDAALTGYGDDVLEKGIDLNDSE